VGLSPSLQLAIKKAAATSPTLIRKASFPWKWVLLAGAAGVGYWLYRRGKKA
jgi:hypothetical protein